MFYPTVPAAAAEKIGNEQDATCVEDTLRRVEDEREDSVYYEILDPDDYNTSNVTCINDPVVASTYGPGCYIVHTHPHSTLPDFQPTDAEIGSTLYPTFKNIRDPRFFKLFHALTPEEPSLTSICPSTWVINVRLLEVLETVEGLEEMLPRCTGGERLEGGHFEYSEDQFWREALRKGGQRLPATRCVEEKKTTRSALELLQEINTSLDQAFHSTTLSSKCIPCIHFSCTFPSCGANAATTCCTYCLHAPREWGQLDPPPDSIALELFNAKKKELEG
ncbi:hypothetical protein HDV05_008308, partial [Chytridiales sp. JEL 0842]